MIGNKISHFFQRYRQAPWRTQRQWIGLALILLVAIVMVAALYLNVTSRTSLAGRSIQALREEIAANQRSNSDYETEYASLTSSESMEQRAEELGFSPAEATDITYIPVQGFVPKPGFMPVTTGDKTAASLIKPEYTESLLEWFGKTMLPSPPDGVQR